MNPDFKELGHKVDFHVVFTVNTNQFPICKYSLQILFCISLTSMPLPFFIITSPSFVSTSPIITAVSISFRYWSASCIINFYSYISHITNNLKFCLISWWLSMISKYGYYLRITELQMPSLILI